uniref:Uncharacterized protein n=1 Tax=Pararge aegeria TaxID=116150 RepID=S4Q087_9NEOP
MINYQLLNAHNTLSVEATLCLDLKNRTAKKPKCGYTIKRLCIIVKYPNFSRLVSSRWILNLFMVHNVAINYSNLYYGLLLVFRAPLNVALT